MSNWYRDISKLIENAQVDPKLKAWFGNSKILDHEGNPAVVYHSTHNDFDEFDRLWAVKNLKRNPEAIDAVGLWFSDNPSAKYGSKQMKCYLKIENPYYIDGEEYDRVQISQKDGSKITVDSNPFYILWKMIDEAGGATNLRRDLEAKGYDGIVLMPFKLDLWHQTAIIAFHNHQIKSVDSKGFDPNHPSIHEGF